MEVRHTVGTHESVLGTVFPSQCQLGTNSVSERKTNPNWYWNWKTVPKPYQQYRYGFSVLIWTSMPPANLFQRMISWFYFAFNKIKFNLKYRYVIRIGSIFRYPKYLNTKVCAAGKISAGKMLFILEKLIGHVAFEDSFLQVISKKGLANTGEQTFSWKSLWIV